MNLAEVKIVLPAENRFSADDLSKLLKFGVFDVDITHNSGNAHHYIERLKLLDNIRKFNLTDNVSTINSISLPTTLSGMDVINLSLKNIAKPSNGKFFKNLSRVARVYITLSDDANQDLQDLIDGILTNELVNNRIKFGFYAPGIEKLMNLNQAGAEYKTKNQHLVKYTYDVSSKTYVFTKPRTS